MGYKAETVGGRSRLGKLECLAAQQTALVAELEGRRRDGHFATGLLRLMRIARDTIDESERIIAGIRPREAPQGGRGARAASHALARESRRAHEAREDFHANELAAFLHYAIDDADRLNTEAAQLLRLAILSLKEGNLASPISASHTLH